MMRPLTRPLVVLAALLVAAAPLAECVIDEPMSRSQMACCAATDHDCGSATLRNDCCPTDGSSQQQLIPSATIQVHPAPPVSSSGPFAWTDPAALGPGAFSAFESFGREILKLPERPTYLLVSSFLI